MRAVLVLFLIMAFPLDIFAATPNEPAYRLLTGKTAYPWNEGLYLFFPQDTNQCKDSYGERWRQKCSGNPGRVGEAAYGIVMQPDAPGFWQWIDNDALKFNPQDPFSLKAATSYTVDLSKLRLPPSQKLDKRKITLTTNPLSVRLVDLDFWINPSPNGAHRLSCAVEFNYPVKHELPIRLKTAPNVLSGNPELVWNGDRDRLNISWPIHKLAEASSACAVVFPELGQITKENGAFRYVPYAREKGGTLFNKTLPGSNELFFVRNASLENRPDSRLDSHYVLKIEPSLYASQEDLLKHLQIYELPEYHSAESREPCNWRLAPGMDESILKKSRKLEPIPVNTGIQSRGSFELTIPATQGRYLLCVLDENFSSSSAMKMRRPWISIMHVEPINPEVGFMQPGNVLSLRHDSMLELFARELDEILWEIQLVREPFMALLASSSWDAFKEPFATLGTDISSFSASSHGKLSLQKGGQGQAQYSCLDLSAILPDLMQKAGTTGQGGLALITLKGKSKNKEKAFAQRLVMFSDLGMIVKKCANGQIQVFVKDLVKNITPADMKVTILGANGLPLFQGTTDESGQILLPSIFGFEKEAKPVALIAGDKEHFSWLPLNDASREINYSGFNIGGMHVSAKDLNILLFSQRDLFRPGDKMLFGCIAKRENLDSIDQDLPLFAELIDPRGKTVWQKTFVVEMPGLADLSWPIPLEALSGRYVLNVRTAKGGPLLQSGMFRVEEFQPETLKLKINPPEIIGWLKIDDELENRQITFHLRNLYGSHAASHKVKASLELRSSPMRFRDFEDYIFIDPRIPDKTLFKRSLSELSTDQKGEAHINLPSDFPVANSMRAIVSAEGFSAGGGRAVVGQTEFLLSPMPYVIGYRPCGEAINLEYVQQGSRAAVELIALDPALNKIAIGELKFSLSKMALANSLVSDENGNFKYGEIPLQEALKNWSGRIAKEGSTLALDTTTPGNFLLQIRDAEDKLLNSISYTVAGVAPALPDATLHPAKLRLKVNEKIVKPGDTLALSLSLPYAGHGLITLERSGVETWEWFEASAGDSVHFLRVPEDFEGKGYVVVNFVRSLDSPRIYMSPLSFAIEPVMVKPVKRDLGLKISAPEKVVPGSEFKVKISGAKKGKAIVYAVDEGILQLTAYQTPNPVQSMLGDRALDVQSLQALDLLMPARVLDKTLSAFGGGMGGAPFGKHFQNPFKRKNEPPLTAWFSNLEFNEKEREISIPVPDYYNGEIRIIAIGVSDEGVDSAWTTTKSIAPFMMDPQMPFYVAPGDTFRGQLVLSNNGMNDEQWDLVIEDSADFKIISSDPASMHIGSGEEKIWNIELRAPELPGMRELRFLGKNGEKTVKRIFSLSVRPAGSLVTEIKSGMIKAGQTLPPGRKVYDIQASSTATISTLPLVLAQGFGEYLRNYPYGCTEQLISRAFASVLLRPWINDKAHSDQGIVEACLDAILNRLTGNGLALWPNGDGDLLLTAYAADFLLTLRQQNISNIDDILDQLCDTLAENCALNEPSLEAARASAYAIWILTREGRITTQLLEDLVLSLRENRIPGWENDVIALLIAASQKEMRFVNTFPVSDVQYNGSAFFDEFAQYALHMALLARYFPDMLDMSQKTSFYEECFSTLNRDDFATFAAAQAIRTIANMGEERKGTLLNARILCPGKEGERINWANGNAQSFRTNVCPQYALEGEISDLFWQISTTGYEILPSQQQYSNGIVIEKEYLDLDGNMVKRVRQGQELQVRVRVRSAGAPIKDCVISDLLPGGLEMILDGNIASNLPKNIKYIDRQEDRMLIFADLDPEPFEYGWKVRAVTEGEFLIPPANAEAMYARQIQGKTPMDKMCIVK